MVSRASYHDRWKELRVQGWSDDIPGLVRDNPVEFVRFSTADAEVIRRVAGLKGRVMRVTTEKELSDASPLQGFRGLQRLVLCGSPDTLDFSAFPNLVDISITAPAADLSRLRMAARLESLSINDCGVRDGELLGGLTTLQTLVIQRAPMRSLAGVETLQRLRTLHMESLPLEDMSPLGALAKLEKLVLVSLTKIRSIAPITRLGALKELLLDGLRKLEDVDAISALTHLERLEVEGTPLPRLKTIQALRELRALVLKGREPLDSLSFIAPLRNLRSLELGMTITDGDMQPLLELPDLRRVRYAERRHYRPSAEDIDAEIERRHGPRFNPKDAPA